MFVSALSIRRFRRYQREVIRIHISKKKHWPNGKIFKGVHHHVCVSTVIVSLPFVLHELGARKA
jgi:hypothetical protein